MRDSEVPSRIARSRTTSSLSGAEDAPLEIAVKSTFLVFA
jgi:hypothetical protein